MQGTGGKRLHARLGRGNGWTALRLDGVIDEHNGLDATVEALGADRALLVDLGGIHRINSVGVRDWVAWLRRLRERFTTVVLFDCPPAIMNEVNLVKNFAEGAVIATFQAPYYCDRCGKEEVRDLDAVAMRRDGVRTAPPFPCGEPACANALDDAEESYFAFFDDQAGVTLPSTLDTMLAAARAAFEGGGGEALGATPSQTPAAAPRRPLDSVGARAAQARQRQQRALPLPSTPPPPAPRRGEGGVDFVFAALLLAMLGVLAVLVYLITTLE